MASKKGQACHAVGVLVEAATRGVASTGASRQVVASATAAAVRAGAAILGLASFGDPGEEPAVVEEVELRVQEDILRRARLLWISLGFFGIVGS